MTVIPPIDSHTQMKAMVSLQYGSPDVLELKEIKKPVITEEHQVLVQVHAVGVNAADWHLLRGKPALMRLMGFGFFKPKHTILGADIAGKVLATGKKITQFKPGDDVFGDLSLCGFGGFAEYAVVPETALVLKPANLSFEEAAAVPMAAVTALKGLRDKTTIQQGHKVLINGASGGVGTFAVQIAKALGAEVTAVCSTRNVDMVRTLGADQVIDYTKEDFTKNKEQYDLILGTNGYHSIFDYKRALRPQGTYVMTGGEPAQMFQAMLLGPMLSKKGGKQLGNILSKPNRQDLVFLKGLLEEGKIRPVIDRTYKLSEVPEAIRYVEEGHARGKVVIKVNEEL